MQISENLKKILTIIWNLTGVLCLIIAFWATYRYMMGLDLMDSPSSEKEQQVVKEKEMRGTYCTLKSNSLDGVPIYAEPGETAQIGFIPEGKCCQILKMRTVEGKKWAQVDYCGLSGWLKMRRVHYISDESCYIQEGSIVFMNALTEKGIKGYREPTVSSEVVVEDIKYGTEYEVLQLKNGWGQVKEEDGTLFWINMYHMGSYPCERWMVETLSSAKEINLRQEPGEKEKMLGKVPEDTRVIISEYQNGWGKIQYNGMDGWVMLHYLTPVAEEAKDNY